jgi:hypothetical protein
MQSLSLYNKYFLMRCILEIARTEFCPRRALRGSDESGGQNELKSREHKQFQVFVGLITTQFS